MVCTYSYEGFIIKIQKANTERYLKMMKISKIYILYLFLSFWGIPLVVGQGNGKDEAYLEKIPVETELDLLFTMVHIQGKPYKLLIDSGAPFCLI